MIVYFINLALILGLGIWLCEYKPSKLKNAIFLIITFGYMFLLSALRFGIGFDYDSYTDIFLKNGPQDMFMFEGLSIEKGFVLIVRAIYCIIGDNSQLFLSVMAAVILFSAAAFIYKFSKRVWISTFLFVTVTFFYGTMNLIRQNLAWAVLLWAYWFVMAKKKGAFGYWLNFLGFAAVTAVAFSIHKSAIIALPVYFIAQIKLNKWWLGGMALVAGAAHIFYEPIVNFVTQYVYQSYGLDSTYMQPLSIVFLVIPAIFAGLAIGFYKKLDANGGRVIANMSIFAFVFWSFVARAMLLERFAIYFYCFVMLLVPELFANYMPDYAERKEFARLGAEYDKQKRRSPKFKDGAFENYASKYGSRVAFSIAALVIVLGATLIYHSVGRYDGLTGFHGVFPYKTKIAWIERLNGVENKDPIFWNDWERERYYGTSSAAESPENQQ